MKTSARKVRIGGASGFWGDSIAGPLQLADAVIDYMVFDYLAETTMAILVGARAKKPELGYATDFVDIAMRQVLPKVMERGIKVIANAGGVNPAGCAQALRAVADSLGLKPRIAVVEGDDVTALLPTLREEGVRDFAGRPLPDKVLSANAYLGAFPVAQALAAGADIVITGRGVDSAVTLGALIHEFGWSAGNFDRLAGGSLAGHILECGCQATGGLFTDWEQVPDWAHMGYPIAECADDGSFELTKLPGTGGLVQVACVAEQLLYEIGDPGAYLLPDVACDFRQVRMEQAGAERVRVSGARGRAPGPQYKVSATQLDGFRCAGTLVIVGIDAAKKAQRTGEAVIERTRGLLARMGFGDYTRTAVQLLGCEGLYGPASRARDAREVMVRIVADHRDRKALDVFAREIAPAGTSWSPGTTGAAGGRPSPSPLIKPFAFLVDKERVAVRVTVDGEEAGAEALRQAQRERVVVGDAALRQAQRERVAVGDAALRRAQGERVAVGDAALRQAQGEREEGVRAEPVEALRASASTQPTPAPALPEPTPWTDPPGEEQVEVPLIRLAWARSGDKGDISNIGLVARRPEWLPLLWDRVTPDVVKGHLEHLVKGRVERFHLPGIHAMNFLLHEALDGGGPGSARFDPLGKGMGQMLLDLPVRVPVSVAKAAGA
jgi:hypothetical protein